MTDLENDQLVGTELFRSWKPKEYIEQRTKQYQSWYDKKAVIAKSTYLRMRSATVLGGVLVPVLVNSPFHGKDIVASIISLAVASCVALESIFHFREQ